MEEDGKMNTDVVLYEKGEGVGRICINRPEVKNALNREVFSCLQEILHRIELDEEVEAVMITGSGNCFVSGADVNELNELEPVSGWFESRQHTSVCDHLERLGKPSIAAINGVAFGGGLELAMACTLRIASKKAKFCLPELSLGILPGFGGARRLVRLVGYGKAAEMILTASPIDADEAYRLGLVNHVVEEGEVLNTALKTAKSILRNGKTAVSLAMEFLIHSEEAPLPTGLSLESALAALSLASEESRNRLSKFVERTKSKKA